MSEAIKENTENLEAVVERPYTLRKLTDGDLVPLLSLFRKLGLKEFKDSFLQAKSGKKDEEIGKLVVLDIADIVISKICGPVGDEIYAFWSDLSGIPVEEIKGMEFGTLPLMIYDSFNEVINTAFFKVVFKLL